MGYWSNYASLSIIRLMSGTMRVSHSVRARVRAQNVKGKGDTGTACQQTSICDDKLTTYPLSGSGVRLDTALRQGDAGSSFGRASTAVSSMAISILGPDSGFTDVVFRTFDFATV